MVHAVIMAGGSGTRFWPWSRRDRPKQVLPLTGPRPIIAETVARLEGLVPIERTYIATLETQVGPLLSAIGLKPPPRIIAEPVGRNTAPCIGLAAVHVRRADPDAVMLVLSADHAIRPVERFHEVMRAGIELASREPVLVTFGIKPTYPATGYGYVHRGEPLGPAGDVNAYHVEGFVEKPSADVARQYVASGQYCWNSGMFCWRPQVILDAIREHVPELHEALERIAGALATASEEAVLRQAYEALAKTQIDKAVLQKAGNLRMVEADFEWTDLGSWASYADYHHDKADEEGNVLSGPCELSDDVRSSLIKTDDGHLIGVVGLQNVVVVHSGNATLVCSKDKAEEVKALVARLEARGLDQFL